MSQIDDLPPLREVIRRYGLTPKKSLGQNFLFDLNLTARIARAAEPLENITVVEVGPGPGGLTRALLALGARRVIAIERDQRAIAALEEIAARYPEQLEIVVGDALSVDVREQLGPERARVVANLPYNIATALLVGWLTVEPWPPWYDLSAADVSARGGRTHRRRTGQKILWAALRAGGLAHRGQNSFRCGTLGIRAATQSDIFGCALYAAAGTARLRRRGAPACYGGCLRPTPQNASAKSQDIGCGRSFAPRRSRYRPDGPSRRNSSRGFCRAGKCFRWAGKSRGVKSQSMQMRRQSLTVYGGPLCETVVNVPRPQGSEVLVRIERCGVCHSDLHMQDGYFVLGGEKNLMFAPGARCRSRLVMKLPAKSKASGRMRRCKIRAARSPFIPGLAAGNAPPASSVTRIFASRRVTSGLPSMAALPAHVLVPHARYLIDYAPLSSGYAGALMCSGLTAYAALKRLADRAARAPLLLVGLGGVGLMGLALARAMYGGAPFVADIDAKKRAAALAAGAAQAFDPSDPSARKAVLKASGGIYGVCDFAGSDASLNFATGVLAKGGKVVVTGLIGGGYATAVAMFPLKAMTIEGTTTGTLERSA